MAINLDVALDLRDLQRFKTLQRASATMAAKSLTFAAEKAQDAWRAENPRAFHMRRPWLNWGVRIKHATPGNLVARVGSIDEYFGRHVEGVDEPKTSSTGRLFVPVQPVAEQGTHTQIRAALRRMERTKTKPFMRGGVLLRRLTRKSDAPLKVLAVLRKSVDIEPRFDALGITEAQVKMHYPRIYERLLLKWAAGR